MPEEESCPNCGKNNLEIDAQNSVVYCKNCGFAAQVNPQTGEVTTLNPGSQGGGEAPAAYASSGSPVESKSIFGFDPLIFFLLGVTLVLSLMAIGIISDPVIGFLFIGTIVVIWWIKK